MNTASSLQHSLELRLAEATEEAEAARASARDAHASLKAARDDARAAMRTPPELSSLRRENGALRLEVSSLQEQISRVGGRIKKLSGQADATSAEERSFLRMLSTVQKDVSAHAQIDADANDAPTKGGRSGGRAPAESATARPAAPAAAPRENVPLHEPAAHQKRPPPPWRVKGGLHEPAEPSDAAARVGSKPTKLRSLPPAIPPLRVASAERATSAERRPSEPSLELPTPPADAAKGGAGDVATSSPRKKHASRRPPTKREAIAQLDPEADERRSKIEALRQRMKAPMPIA